MGLWLLFQVMRESIFCGLTALKFSKIISLRRVYVRQMQGKIFVRFFATLCWQKAGTENVKLPAGYYDLRFFSRKFSDFLSGSRQFVVAQAGTSKQRPVKKRSSSHI